MFLSSVFGIGFKERSDTTNGRDTGICHFDVCTYI